MSTFTMSDEDKRYYRNDASMATQFEIVGKAFDNMPSVGSAFASAGRGVTNWASGLGPGVSNYVKKVRHIYDDNVVIPAGYRTLLNYDISRLFLKSREEPCKTMAGTGMVELVNESRYDTEMASGNLSSGSSRSLETFTPEQKAAFEIVLLSKYFSACYMDGDADGNEKWAQLYSDEMTRYKAACADKNINWDEVMNYACWEMQAQSARYRDGAKGIYKPEESDWNRIVVNRAHSMVVQCGNEGWEETMLPHVASRIEKEDTYDTSPQTKPWLEQISTWLMEKWASIKEKLGSPWKGIQGMTASLLDTMDTYATYNKLVSQEHNAEYKAAAERFVDTIHGTAEKVGDAAKPYVDKAKDVVSDKYDKAKEHLGITDGDVGASQENGQEAALETP